MNEILVLRHLEAEETIGQYLERLRLPKQVRLHHRIVNRRVAGEDSERVEGLHVVLRVMDSDTARVTDRRAQELGGDAGSLGLSIEAEPAVRLDTARITAIHRKRDALDSPIQKAFGVESDAESFVAELREADAIGIGRVSGVNRNLFTFLHHANDATHRAKILCELVLIAIRFSEGCRRMDHRHHDCAYRSECPVRIVIRQPMKDVSIDSLELRQEVSCRVIAHRDDDSRSNTNQLGVQEGPVTGDLVRRGRLDREGFHEIGDPTL